MALISDVVRDSKPVVFAPFRRIFDGTSIEISIIGLRQSAGTGFEEKANLIAILKTATEAR